MSMISEANRFNPRPLASPYGGRSFGIRYPSPFFDVAQQFLPANVHQLHLWCRYYFFTNPIINVAVSKMAEFPVTPLIYETDSPEVMARYAALEKQLRLRSFQVEVGLDYWTYGNAFVSVFFPFIKFLVCRGCGARYQAEKSRSLYKWRNMRFQLRCTKCKLEDVADERDVTVRSLQDIRLVRWNPENIEIKYNEITGSSKYFFKIPKAIINDITMGEPDVIEQLPMAFVDAARKGRALIFHKDNFYHLKRPALAEKDQGWGTPLIYPVLKDAFYTQVMKKGQEAILMEHIVPLRVVYPGAPSGGNDNPFGAYNLQNWKAKIDYELSLWKRDPNYIPILPVNVGFQQWGGTAKALIMHNEFRVHYENMLSGMGVPPEFVYGGLNWSPSNTALRALENTFTGYNKQRLELISDFILGRIADFMQWPKVKTRFDRFKMADDLQRSMFYLQLNQAQKVSDQRLHEELGEDTNRELDRMEEELKRQGTVQRKMQTGAADIQGEVLLRTTRYQVKAQALQMQSQMAIQQEAAAAQAAAGGAPGQPPGAAPGGQPGAEGQPQVGPDGQPMQPPGPPQATPIPNATAPASQQMGVPGMPEGATAYEENAGGPNNSKLPAGFGSYLQPGMGGVDITYMAQRAAAYLRTVQKEMGEEAMQQELAKMKMSNPQLGQLVQQLLEGDTGSKINPMNAAKAPAPDGTKRKDPSRTIG